MWFCMAGGSAIRCASRISKFGVTIGVLDVGRGVRWHLMHDVTRIDEEFFGRQVTRIVRSKRSND